MKVILNEDVKHLGEMGDVKNVANGYARNFLFPHMFAVPYNADTVAYFEAQKTSLKQHSLTLQFLQLQTANFTVPLQARQLLTS